MVNIVAFYCGQNTAILGVNLLKGIVLRQDSVAKDRALEIYLNSHEFDSDQKLYFLTCQYIEEEGDSESTFL